MLDDNVSAFLCRYAEHDAGFGIDAYRINIVQMERHYDFTLLLRRPQRGTYVWLVLLPPVVKTAIVGNGHVPVNGASEKRCVICHFAKTE